MTSNIDPTIPVEGNPTTASVRANFAEAAVEISALQASAAGAPFLSLSGGAMSGALSLAGDPVGNMNPVTLQYFNAHNASFGDAPSTGNAYGRLNASWAQVPTAAQAGANAGRNLIDNALFNIQQRTGSPWTTSGAYTADRWRLFTGGDTTSVSVQPLSDTQRAQIGDESATSCLQNVFTGGASAGSWIYIVQGIERLRRLSGKQVTVSFYAVASSASLKLGVNAAQMFGTGGSPSTNIWAQTTGNAVQLTTSWARYSTTITLPSASGMTLGTNGDDYTQICFFYSSGANDNAAAGNIGVQSGTISIWGIQAEFGTQATQLEKIPPSQEMMRCMRMYQTGNGTWGGYLPAGTYTAYIPFALTPMRAAPNAAITPSGGGGWSAVNGISTNPVTFVVGVTSTALGIVNFNYIWTASAEY
jgi:hypothetical protein